MKAVQLLYRIFDEPLYQIHILMTLLTTGDMNVMVIQAKVDWCLAQTVAVVLVQLYCGKFSFFFL